MSSTIDFEELQRYGNLELLAKQVVEGFITGLHKSPFHGFSVEFSEHRVYNPGESTRHIDWKLMARSDKTFVKRYEDETNLRCQLVIDVSSSMYFPEGQLNKIKFSIYAAAAMIQLLRHQRDAFGLTLIDSAIETHLDSKSTRSHQQIIYNKLDALLKNPPQKATTNLAPAIHQLAETLHKRSLVVIFSDFFESPEKSEELFAALQHLKFSKHEIILFQVTDEAMEQDFEFSNRPYRFVDLETGEEVKLMPAEVKEAYLKNIRAFNFQLHQVCTRYGIDLNEARVGTNFNQVLMSFFVKRERLK